MNSALQIIEAPRPIADRVKDLKGPDVGQTLFSIFIEVSSWSSSAMLSDQKKAARKGGRLAGEWKGKVVSIGAVDVVSRRQAG